MTHDARPPTMQYNAVNGVPSCANNWLLGTLLRDSWGFDGAVVSDCDADGDVFDSHHYTSTPELAVQAVLRAGTDVDCGSFVTQHAQSALNQGVITQADIDAVLVRAFKLRIRLGHFDPAGPLQTIGADQICNDYCELECRCVVVTTAGSPCYCVCASRAVL